MVKILQFQMPLSVVRLSSNTTSRPSRSTPSRSNPGHLTVYPTRVQRIHRSHNATAPAGSLLRRGCWTTSGGTKRTGPR
jgi:hypothetical protein